MKKSPPGFFISSVFLILLLAVACNDNNNNNHEGELVISANIHPESPTQLILEELTPSDVIIIDTIYPDEQGYFKYTLLIQSAGFYRLRLPKGDFITLAAEPHEEIHIKAAGSNLRKSYTVAGSEGSSILWQLNRKQLQGMQQADSLRQIYREHRHDPDFAEHKMILKQEYKSIKEDQRQFVIGIIENNPTTLASVLALYQFFEDNMLLDETGHFEYFSKLSKSLCTAYPSNKHVINLKKRVNDIKREEQQKKRNEENLAIGKIAPNITLPDPGGNQVSLSSLEGNIVLLDFWASWCPPCREANTIIGELHKKYSGQGFEVYSVSLDRTRDQWVDAIKKDNISWQQVSDLRFMNSPVVSLYNITEVPQYLLIDRERKIIARNFNIHELEDLLKENL